MKYLFACAMVVLLSGCATWSGIKRDASDGAEWTKEKINKGAEYIKEKTEQEKLHVKPRMALHVKKIIIRQKDF